MDIRTFRAWLKTQPRDRKIAGIEERLALEAIGRALPEFENLIAQVTLGAIMQLDPETMWLDPKDINLDALENLLKDENYTLTIGEWLEAISRLKLTRNLGDDYELFDPVELAPRLRSIMDGMEVVSMEKSLRFRKIVSILEDLRDYI